MKHFVTGAIVMGIGIGAGLAIGAAYGWALNKSS